jgi:cell division transport system permease protein
VISWLERHFQTMVGSLGRLWTQPFATLLTIMVIGIALALPACLHVLVQNVRVASGGWGNALDISVYMKPQATLEQARTAAERVRQRRDVESVTLVEADDALEEFRKGSGFGEALDALKDNPLPHALVVRPAAEFREPNQVVSLTTELRGLEGVDIVQLDTAWVSRFNAILDVVRRVVLLAVGLFALGVLVIIGNTIRLDIENRRDEIEVTKLVGGSDAFVRRPFLYNGVWYGLGGGPDRLAGRDDRDHGAGRPGAAHRGPLRQRFPAARPRARGQRRTAARRYRTRLGRLVHCRHAGAAGHRAQVGNTPR